MRIYRAASSPLKRQCAWTLLFVLSIALVHAADSGAAAASSTSSWLTPQNILTAVALIYGAGMLREQFLDVRGRLKKQEDAFEKFIAETAPETYARIDVIDARLRPIEKVLGSGDPV